MVEELQTFRLSRFKGYEFSYRKSMPLGETHPQQKESTRTEYYSKGQKAFNIKNLETNVIRKFMVFDERGFNTCNINGSISQFTPIIGIDVDMVADFFMNHFNEFKASDPSYGTYSSLHRSYFAEGKKNLYMHDFMHYVSMSDRREKILIIKKRMESKKQLINA